MSKKKPHKTKDNALKRALRDRQFRKRIHRDKKHDYTRKKKHKRPISDD